MSELEGFSFKNTITHISDKKKEGMCMKIIEKIRNIHIHINTPKWKVREYVRLIIGILMAIVLMVVLIYLTMYGQWLRIEFLNDVFG